VTTAVPLDPLDLLAVARVGPLIIRQKVESDHADDYAWRCDPEVARYDGNRPLTMSFAEYVRHVEREAALGPLERCSFGLVLEDGRHIGNIMYYNAGPSRESAELGLTIGAADCRGQGLGSAATIAFLRYIWREYPFRRIYLHTLEWNARARRCFENAGFAAIARVFRNDQWFIRMEARREWWLLWDQEGRFAARETALRASRTGDAAAPGLLPPVHS
jgi:RimJ/RimL family protein N-acetyltransferase